MATQSSTGRREPRRTLHDYAIVLGVMGPGSGASGAGSEARAHAFLDWLTAPDGGELPSERVRSLIGPADRIGRASLREMLRNLVPDVAEQWASGPVGRRCYLYLSGPAIGTPEDVHLVAVEASGLPRMLDASLQGFVDDLRRGRLFEEVVAFADVERLTTEAMLAESSVEQPARVRDGPQSKAFIGVFAPFASGGSGPEVQSSPDLDPLGFTGAVIEGLRGQARDERGAISTVTLAAFATSRLTSGTDRLRPAPRFTQRDAPFVLFTPEIVRARARRRAAMPNAYALLIGIDEYAYIPPLSSCAADARAVAAALAGNDAGGYDPANVRVLTNGDATRAAVTAALASLARECDAESTVFIWFAGRAVVDSDSRAKIFLADDRPDDEDSGLDAAQMDELLDRFAARRIVVVFDTSGGCAGITPRRGRITLSATLPAEDAYDGTAGRPGGDFTQAILRGLEGGAGGATDAISVFDLFEYAHAEVVALGRQHPTIGMVWGEIGFPIARRRHTTAVRSIVDADGYAYDVHVVHPLSSPRAGFVEDTLLPALRDANLRVAVSAPLETSPVPRVVQIERGLRRARKTLLLGSRRHRDGDVDDVIRLALESRPPLVDVSALLVVAIEGGRPSASERGERVSQERVEPPALIETESFDLIAAQTADHPSIRRLIERLRAPVVATPRESGAPTTERDVPLVEITESRPTPDREGWLLSGADSAAIIELASSTSAVRSRAPSRVRVQRGDVLFLRDPSSLDRIVGVTRVLRALRPAVPSPLAARLLEYDLAPTARVNPPAELEAISFLRTPAGGESTMVPADVAEKLAGLCIASDRGVAEPVAEWLDRSVSAIAVSLCIDLVRRGTRVERDVLFPGLVPLLALEAQVDLLRVARSLEDPIRRGATLRGVIGQLLEHTPGDLSAIEAFRRDEDPSVRALVSRGRSVAPTTAQRFTYSCFLDGTSQNPLVASISTRLTRQLAQWLDAPLITDPDVEYWIDVRATSELMRRSACIVLVWSSATSRRTEWFELASEAGAIEAARAEEFRRAGGVGTLESVVTVVVDATAGLPPGLPGQRAIFVNTADRADDEVVDRAVGQLTDVVLAASQLWSEVPLAPNTIATAAGLDRITVEMGDILDTSVDAIVNPVGNEANRSGYIGLQLVQRVGEAVIATLAPGERLAPGDTVVRPTLGRIPARHVVHTCIDLDDGMRTPATVTAGALGALRTAATIADVRTIALPAIGSGAAELAPIDVARELIPRVAEHLAGSDRIEAVRFVFRELHAARAYASVLDALRAGTPTLPASINATQWYVSARRTSNRSAYVGSAVDVEVLFSSEPTPNAVPLLVPHSALELTAYIDATAAFQLEGSSQRTVRTLRGRVEEESLTVRLMALTSGVHTIRISFTARGASTAAAHAVVSCIVPVEPPILLPDIPELIDKRTIPPPRPDIILYVAIEQTPGGEQLRYHLTCPAIGLDGYRFAEPVLLSRGDVAAIQLAAAEVASEIDGSSPPDVRAALLAFGGTLYDIVAPLDHEFRGSLSALLNLAHAASRSLSWLVVSDEAAVLPWELVCAYGYDENIVRWYDEPIGARFAVAHWIGRRGFELASEAPVGPLGIVHYGQRAQMRPLWRTAVGPEVASDADHALGLDILRRGSPYFGVHLLRFTDPAESGRIVEATDARPSAESSEPLAGEQRLDFTLRRPIVSLSVVDEQLDRFDRWPSPESRFVNIEQAWSVPFLLARVSAVVGPRWTTAPSADLVFYKAFYDAVRSDVPLGLAVSLARTSVRAAHPDRADWLAYTYFGHPACEPYPVETAEAFAMFEPLGVAAGESFVAGRTYTFRASYRSELPAWYRGRRRARTQRVDGDGVQVLVAPVSGGEPATYDLVPASGDARGTADDYYAIVTLTMPNGPSRYKVFVQFTRGEDELRSTVMALPVVRDEHALLAGTTVVAAPVTDVGAG